MFYIYISKAFSNKYQRILISERLSSRGTSGDFTQRPETAYCSYHCEIGL